MASRTRRLAVISTSYPSRPGDAAGHFVAAECRALALAGHQVVAIVPGPGPRAARPPAEPLGEGSLRVLRLPGGGAFGLPGILARLRAYPPRALGVLTFVARARRELGRLGPLDGVIAHWLLPSGWPIGLATDAPLEVVVHGSDLGLLLSLPGPLGRRVLSSLVAHGATFRCVSQDLRARLVAAGPPEVAARSSVRPAELSLPLVASREVQRARLGVQNASRLIVIVGRLVAPKRIATALAAATLVPRAGVVVIGDGPEREGLEGRFPDARFLGQLSRPATLAWLRAADLILSASRAEGAPTVIREARALGTPVVAAPAGDLVEWAQTDPGLWVVGTGDSPPPASPASQAVL